MGFGSSRSVADTRVYAQDTEPQDTRDGIIWVDTSADPRDTYVYSTASVQWEDITPPSTADNSNPIGYLTEGPTWSDGDTGTIGARLTQGANSTSWHTLDADVTGLDISGVDGWRIYSTNTSGSNFCHSTGHRVTTSQGDVYENQHSSDNSTGVWESHAFSSVVGVEIEQIEIQVNNNDGVTHDLEVRELQYNYIGPAVHQHPI